MPSQRSIDTSARCLQISAVIRHRRISRDGNSALGNADGLEPAQKLHGHATYTSHDSFQKVPPRNHYFHQGFQPSSWQQDHLLVDLRAGISSAGHNNLVVGVIDAALSIWPISFPLK
jgi:hypothetical protein